MPFQSVVLQPGINIERTLSLNEAGMAESNLVRFKSGLIQKIGGWVNYFPTSVSSTPIRDITVFVSLRDQAYLGIAALDRLVVVSTTAMLTDITPQIVISNPVPSFSVSSGSNVVTVVDPGSSMSQYGAIRLDTPISLSNLLLQGGYPVNTAVDANTYTILASAVSCATISSGGTLPTFTTAANSAAVNVIEPNHKYLVNNYYQFEAATNVAGQVIQGPYFVTSIIDSTNVLISLTAQASATVGPAAMNGGNAAIHHYMVIGPPQTAGAYGAGNYGAGNYGFGTPPGQGTGSRLISDDWSLDADWTALIACSRGDAIYTWSAEQALQTAQPIVEGGAPLKCNGAFVSHPQQMVVAWGAQSLTTGVQDPLLIRWSDGANFNQWTPTNQNQAGSFRVPSGAVIRGGLQAPLYMVFWTDIDFWIAQYVGQPLTWSFTYYGTGCGLIGQHAAELLAGTPYWMSTNNFYMTGGEGAQPLPCPVWDFVFQQIDVTNSARVRCAANSAFNEISWYFPVIGGNGENSAYVKLHIEREEYEWDFGYLDRSAWVDVSAAGMAIGADSHGNIVQHETGFDAAGTPINASVETGYFAIGDGHDFAFIDFVIPDFIWGTFPRATTGTINITFFATDFPGDDERSYGPYSVTQGSEYISTRIRGRLMRMRFESTDLGSFWRIGRIRYRWRPDGLR